MKEEVHDQAQANGKKAKPPLPPPPVNLKSGWHVPFM
jgi:hypothetical protein